MAALGLRVLVLLLTSTALACFTGAGGLTGAAGFLATTFAAGLATGFAAAFLGAAAFETGFAAGLADLAAGFATGFFDGAAFFTGVAFLAGLAAFLLDAILLGFFCNKHF